jgi:Pyridoxamine 5'-phosphate oxidase
MDGIEGAPFGSFVDYVLDDCGNPVLLMNEMSIHTMNIQKATELSGEPPLVTLFTQLSGGSSSSGTASLGSGPNSNHAANALPGGSKSSQDVARCSLTGTLEKINIQTATDLDVIRMRYSLTHAYANQVMDSPKFAFYRLTPKKIYYVGGFGVLAKWVEPDQYRTATPDILAQEGECVVVVVVVVVDQYQKLIVPEERCFFVLRFHGVYRNFF